MVSHRSGDPIRIDPPRTGPTLYAERMTHTPDPITGPARTKAIIGPHIAACLACLVSLLAAGCVGYATYPAADGQPKWSGANAPPITEATIAALSWAAERTDLPETDEGQPAAAFNLYEGVSRSTYEFVSRRVGDELAPLSMATLDLPRFHVVQIRLRGASAQVDLLRPVTSLPPGAAGRYPLEPLTLHLDSAAGKWRVERRQRFEIASQEPPQAVMIPAQRDAASRLIKGEGEP